MRAELIYNAFAGRIIVRRDLTPVIGYLERIGWSLSVHETRAPLQATELAQSAAQRGADVVIAAGGDGTINEVTNGLVHTETALGVLPIGTTNVWALQMRIPALSQVGPTFGISRFLADIEDRIAPPVPLSHHRQVLLEAARVLAEGAVHRVDVGQANDRYFLLWAGVGLDAAVTGSIPPEARKAFGPLATVSTAFDVARDYRSADVRLTLDRRTIEVNTALIVASNIQLYGGVFPLGVRACVDDGLLDVCVFKGEGVRYFVQHALKVVSRQHLQAPEIEYHQGRELVVESDKQLPVQVDDEPFAETPVTIRAIPRALNVILPHNAPSELFSRGEPTATRP